MRKKILFIAPSPMYLEKGSSLRMYSMVKNLSKKYKIDLITYSTGRNFNLNNVSIYRTSKLYKPSLKIGRPSVGKILLDFLILLKAVRLIFKNNYNLIHCEDFEGAFIGYLLKKFISSKSKLVYDLHNRIGDNLSINNKNTKILKFAVFLERIIVDSTDLIIFNWDKYKKENIFKGKKFIVYYDQIDYNLKKLSFSDKKYIIYTGNFEPYQGVKEFLLMCKGLNKKIKIFLVGEKTNNIEEFVNKNGLAKKVVFFGRLSIPETNYLIKNSLFCVIPRKFGRQPGTKLIQYLIMGKPILASNLECNRELLIENKNALFYNDSNQFKSKFNILTRNKSIISKLTNGANETGKQIKDLQKEEKFLKEYEKGSNNYS